jgi:hypothetical protein
VIFTMVGVSSLIGTSLTTGFIWFVAGIAAWAGPALLPKLGHRGTGIAGFATACGVRALHGPPYILPVAATIMMWGHAWPVTTHERFAPSNKPVFDA